MERTAQLQADEQQSVFHDTMQRACEAVQKRAQHYIGSYHGAAGPFAAWEKLAPSTVEDRVRHGYAPDQPLLREGTLRASIEYTIKGNQGWVGSNLDIAVFQELGTSRIPPRPFLELAPRNWTGS